MSTELTTPIKIEIPGLGTIESADLYLKSEADKVIAELKDENRRLKRALYKACANWMIDRQCAMSCFHLEVRAKKFDKAIDKCRSMAEEYK